MPSCAPATPAGMQLCGGKPLASVRAVVVYWSSDTLYRGAPPPGTSGTGVADTSLVGTFLRNLGGSPWWRIESTYGVGGLSYEAFWANNVHAPVGSQLGSFVSEAQVVAMLEDGIAAERVPAGSNVVYIVLTSPMVTSVSGFPTICGDHNASGSLIYAVIPYAWNTYCEAVNASTQLSPNDDPAVDAILTSIAHEVAEAASDPRPNTGWQWVGHTGGENADRCGRDFSDNYVAPNGGRATIRLAGRDYLIQKNWVNADSGRCALGLP